jgi:hypothetical protein
MNCHKTQMIGPTEEELLTALYYDLSKWLEDVKTVCKQAGIPLEQHLSKALGLAIEAGRVRDCNYYTALKLRGLECTGQDILLFFIKKCTHARDAFLRGELPPYPWRILQHSGQERNVTTTKEEKGSVNVVSISAKKVQVDNIQQAGRDASIHKQTVTAEKKKGNIKKILKTIAAVVGFLAALLTIFNYLDWI